MGQCVTSYGPIPTVRPSSQSSSDLNIILIYLFWSSFLVPPNTNTICTYAKNIQTSKAGVSHHAEPGSSSGRTSPKPSRTTTRSTSLPVLISLRWRGISSCLIRLSLRCGVRRIIVIGTYLRSGFAFFSFRWVSGCVCTALRCRRCLFVLSSFDWTNLFS